MFIKVKKNTFLVFLLENKKVVSAKLIERILDQLIELENIKFDFALRIALRTKRKIKSVLNYLKRRWNRIERNGQHARRRFIDECRNKKVELEIEFSAFNNESMDVDPVLIEDIFNDLRIK